MMNAMVEQNLLTDLTNWECAKVMPKAYADAYTFDGKLVGMCQGAAFSTMFYNMDILNEAGLLQNKFQFHPISPPINA